MPLFWPDQLGDPQQDFIFLVTKYNNCIEGCKKPGFVEWAVSQFNFFSFFVAEKAVGVAGEGVYASIIQSSLLIKNSDVFWTQVEKYKSCKASADSLRFVRFE